MVDKPLPELPQPKEETIIAELNSMFKKDKLEFIKKSVYLNLINYLNMKKKISLLFMKKLKK